MLDIWDSLGVTLISFYMHPRISKMGCPSIHLSIHPSVHLSICQSVHPSIHQSIHSSISLSVTHVFRILQIVYFWLLRWMELSWWWRGGRMVGTRVDEGGGDDGGWRGGGQWWQRVMRGWGRIWRLVTKLVSKELKHWVYAKQQIHTHQMKIWKLPAKGWIPWNFESLSDHIFSDWQIYSH